jgi:hydrogenase nickel incorporation protein HypA/HybF
MHELPLLRAVVSISVERARRAGASRVVAVDLTVGELRGLDAGWMQRSFALAARGTPAEAATLRITQRRAVVTCAVCGLEQAGRDALELDGLCARCSTRDLRVSAGDELLIESIDVV